MAGRRTIWGWFEHLHLLYTLFLLGFPGSASDKKPNCQCRRCKRCRFDPWISKMPCRSKWQPAPVILAWRIPWTEDPGRQQSMGLQRVRHHWVTEHYFLFLLLWHQLHRRSLGLRFQRSGTPALKYHPPVQGTTIHISLRWLQSSSEPIQLPSLATTVYSPHSGQSHLYEITWHVITPNGFTGHQPPSWIPPRCPNTQWVKAKVLSRACGIFHGLIHAKLFYYHLPHTLHT